MSRPLRLEFPGALLHVTSRGNERKSIVTDDDDRVRFLDLLGEAVDRFKWLLYQYVLMTNHYHFVLELSEPSLSRGMQWLNGTYAKLFNRRHRRVGHLLQGRFDSRLVQKESYLLEVVRYDALNPVRAGMVTRPEAYRWSGHNAIAGLCDAPQWLAVEETRRLFAPDRETACAYYASFVDRGLGIDRSPWEALHAQIYLGDENWVQRMRDRVESQPRSDDYPRPQRNPVSIAMNDVIAAVAVTHSLSEWTIRASRGGDARMLAAWLACHYGQLDLRSIAAALRVRSSGWISEMIASCDERLDADPGLRELAERCVAILQGVQKPKTEALTP